jgi:hypothetical protein
MAYMDFPDSLEGQKKRKAFWLSEEGRILIAGWRRHGVAITTIATEQIGVSKTAFWGWYKESEELRQACAVAKEVADLAVEDALWRKAVGYDYWEERWDLIEGELRLAQKFKKHMPPDTKAIAIWLYNRSANDWRQNQEPLEQTQYTESIKNVLIAMKEVAENGAAKEVEIKGSDTPNE